MSTTTTNYGLIKPDTTDPILIGQLNDNSDAIDAALKENADAIENKPDAADIPSPSTAAPAMNGTAAAGTSTDYARADHIHPSDTSKQDALSTAQLAAVNSGIDSAKVAQIETNENNISSNWGAKNLLVNRGSLREISPDDDITYTWVNGDVSVTGTKVSEVETYADVIPVTPLSDLGLSDKVVISNNGTKCFLAIIFWSNTLGLSSIYEIVSGSNIIDVPSGYTHIMARLGVKEGVTGTINETIQPMICTKAQWDISHEYQPYPFSNAELTNDVTIEDITSSVTATTGYTLKTVHTHLYRQGKHVFGEIQIAKDSGYYSTTNNTVATIASAYMPKVQYLGCGGFGAGEWEVNAVGTAYIDNTTGKIKVDTQSQNNNIVTLQISYVIN